MPDARTLNSARILLVAEYYPSGGTRTYVRQLLEFYREQGAQVTLTTTSEAVDPEFSAMVDDMDFTMLTFQEVLAASGVEYTGLPNVWSPLRWRQERAAFRRLAEHLGITRIVVSAGTPGMLLGAAAARPDSIYILHTYPHGRRQDHLARPYLSRLIPPGTRLVTVSEFERAIVERLWRTRERGVSVTTILSSCGALSSNRSAVTAPWTVLTVALLEYYKRPLEWVAIAAEVARQLEPGAVRFVWLGDGSMLDAARRAADEVRDVVDISFPGVSEDPSPAYEDGRVYFQNSSIENMSLAVIDALRHGLPSVVTNVGGLPEIVTHEVDGLVVDVADPAAAVDAITTILTDPSLWQRLSTAARDSYLARHSWEAWSAALVALHR